MKMGKGNHIAYRTVLIEYVSKYLVGLTEDLQWYSIMLTSIRRK